MTDDQTKQVERMLLALAEAKVCQVCHSPKNNTCNGCNGSGLDPRTELFRVELRCTSARWPHPEDCYCFDSKYRPLTVAEAEAKGLAIQRKFKLDVEYQGKGWPGLWAAQMEPLKAEFGDTPLLAILAAVCAACGVEVTA